MISATVALVRGLLMRAGMHRPAALLFLSLSLGLALASAGTAAADPGPPPGSPPGATAPTPPAPSPVSTGVPPDSGRSLRTRTQSFVFPTGNLVPKGKFDVRLDLFGVRDTIAVGLTDHIEVHAGGLFVPALASAGVRVGLLGRDSPFKLTVGGSGWLAPRAENGEAVSGSITAAYSTDEFNLHATVGALKPVAGDAAVRTYDVGASYRVGDDVALLGEAVRVWLPTGEECANVAARSSTQLPLGGGCSDPGETMDAVVVGAKLMGKHFDADVGLLVPRHAIISVLRALPVASVSYRF